MNGRKQQWYEWNKDTHNTTLVVIFLALSFKAKELLNKNFLQEYFTLQLDVALMLCTYIHEVFDSIFFSQDTGYPDYFPLFSSAHTGTFQENTSIKAMNASFYIFFDSLFIYLLSTRRHTDLHTQIRERRILFIAPVFENFM